MKTMKQGLCLLATISLLLAWVGCKRCDDPTNPDCRNYDPCYEKTAVSAGFEMGVSFFQRPRDHPLSDTFLVSDTVLSGSKAIEFRGPDGYDSYVWTIGDDSRTFSEQSFSLNFIHPEPNPVEIKLIVSRTPAPDCFPGDTGKDTAIQYLSVLPHSQAAILGRYRGIIASQPQDSFEVWIARHDSFSDPSYHLFNLNQGCMPQHVSLAGDLGYDIYLQKKRDYIAGDCEGVIAWAFLHENRRDILIDYRTYYPIHTDIFTGIKIE